MDLEKDIYIALLLLDGNEDVNKLGNYNLVYGNTNENLAGYFKYFPIKDGNILTIASSGDQILQSVFCGAKEIHAFDYNPLAIYMAKLKVCAFNYLDYQDFNDYILNFDVSYYKKIREYLDNDTRLLWDQIYNNIRYNNQLDNLIIVVNNSRLKKGLYSEYKNYYDTKKKLKNVDINYYCADVYDILNHIPSDIKFDAAFLSNIFDWMNQDKKFKYPLFIKKDLDSFMKDNGMIAVYCSVNGYKDTPLDIIFTDNINADSKNRVLVYKK